MSSVIGICNMALYRIGNSTRIDDLSEASVEAEVLGQFYENCRDYVLRADCDWGFATAFAQLAEVETNPNPEFSYAYAVPNDCIRVRRIVNTAWQQGVWPCDPQSPLPEIRNIKFRIINGGSQRLISTSVSPATIEYTVKVESPEMFDPIFVSALSWYLAAQVAAPLSKSDAIVEKCAGMYKAEILAAAAAALNEGVATYPRESVFITGRGA
ncbi:hypothetical protein [Pseudomonas sp. NUPR-001]|uniref:hypothetical protein n=1 Tax=Pseudomonas sp. NUPR-001 TaxID=3416058 RepID=UPI003F9AF385